MPSKHWMSRKLLHLKAFFNNFVGNGTRRDEYWLDHKGPAIMLQTAVWEALKSMEKRQGNNTRFCLLKDGLVDMQK